MSLRAGYGTARMAISPVTVFPVSELLMWSTDAPPSLRSPPIASPMLPAPKMVTLVMLSEPPVLWVLLVATTNVTTLLVVATTSFASLKRMPDVDWLSAEERAAWVRFAAVVELLPGVLNAQL